MEDNLKELRKTTPEELMLRFNRAKLCVLLQEIKACQQKYEKATGKKAPSLQSLIDEVLN